MIHTTINLPMHSIENNGFQPTLTTYIIDNSVEIDSERKRPLVLICPGGAYGFTSDREAEPIALKMNALGFHACVLRYSVAPMDFPAALIDLCEAVYCVRSYAAEWNVDSDRIIVAGFSAGGHLAASLGVYWNAPFIRKYSPHCTSELIKPNALLLSYPVITAGEFAHKGSIVNCLGDSKHIVGDFVPEADKDPTLQLSLEKLVNTHVPPTFLWHTYADEAVSVENSLLFASALRKNNVPFELHIFSQGPHALGLATEETACSSNPNLLQADCAKWPELFAAWVKNTFC